ncbi:MAG TPA: hypothetical protein VF553_19180 [Pyrinomonadaceae bacterium]|jgi:hypothetical protein
MAQVIDVEDNNCSLRGFERNRYFFGKPMTVRDFDQEQRYFNGKRYLLNRIVHGGGIVCGLGLTANETGGFTLKAGAAIDCCGREIVVGSDYSKTDLTELEGFRGEFVGKTIFLCLMYDECIREPVHTNANASACTDICDYNRIREGFRVVIKPPPTVVKKDFCEVASSKKIVFEDARLRLERIAPLWVNPKEVFEVRLVATPKNVSGALVMDVEEGFTPPPDNLTVVQGIPPLTNRVSFSLTQAGGVVQKTYLLRAGAATVDTQIKAAIFFPATSEQKTEAQGSAVKITPDKISDLMVGKIFKDEELGACKSCTEDHCLYLASARLDGDNQLSEIKLFPSNQYVYNNMLLFELLACSENRIGKIPEIPVSNATQQVLPAVTAFKFFKGLTAADGGLGLANVTAQVDKGLKIESETIVADLGKGTKLDGNHISADLGKGVVFNGNHIEADIGTGLVFDGNHIKADLGKGVMLDGNHIDADLGKGVVFNGNHIEADLGNGLMFDANHIAARTGQGVKLSGNLIAANLGDGLKLDGTDRITASVGSGLSLTGGKIVANIGNGLKFVADQIQPDYSTASVAGRVCEANDPRLSNARPPLPHAVTHQNGGADEINVAGLSGVLQDAQKVQVQDEGTNIAARPKLNFAGQGVTVTDDAAQNRVNINIPQGSRVSTGQVKFQAMGGGETRFSPVINHGFGTDECALVFAMVTVTDSGPLDFFGDLAHIETNPLIFGLSVPGAGTFYIMVVDRRVRNQAEPMDYTIRWWAIPRSTDMPDVLVPPRANQPANVRVTEDDIRLSAFIRPGLTQEELAESFGVTPSKIKTQLKSLQESEQIDVVDGKIFTK